MKEVNIYTDGACSGNQNEENLGGWGCVLEYGEHTKELCGGEANTTNNRMELTALIEGLAALKSRGLSVRCFSDSSYLIRCFQEKWYLNWQKNGWKTSQKKPVENRDLWERLLGLMEGQELRFYLVKGHLNLGWPDEKLQPYYRDFQKHNGPFPFEGFKKVVAKNIRCDELANVFINEHR